MCGSPGPDRREAHGAERASKAPDRSEVFETYIETYTCPCTRTVDHPVLMREFGPNPGRVYELAELARELDLLRARAAAGTRKPKVSLEDLTRLVRVPRSTLHRYVTGQTL